MSNHKVSGVFYLTFVVIENIIVESVDAIMNAKESLFIPWIKRFWPSSITPNMLCYFRIFVGVVVIPSLFYWQGYAGNLYIAALLLLAILTDFLDGLVARAKNLTSKFGSLLDKWADKLLYIPLAIQEFWGVSKPIVILSVGGAAVVLTAATLKWKFSANHDVPENLAGKVATLVFAVAIFVAIWPEFHQAALKLAWAGFALGFVSAFDNFLVHFGVYPNRRKQ